MQSGDEGLLHVGLSCKLLVSQLLIYGTKETEITGRETETTVKLFHNLPTTAP
jgi:hypothetical protein